MVILAKPDLQGVAMKTKMNKATKEKSDKSKRLPALFIGHGSPMNAMPDH